MTKPSRQVQVLARRWGQPRFIEKRIPVAPGLKEQTVRDFYSDRWGEVVMAIRRATDELMWVMTKESFPRGLYSLPTGGIRHQETISAALWRELEEETGFDARLRQFLAVIHYVPAVAAGDLQDVPGFFSYIFLLEEMDGRDPVVSGGEKILGFKTVGPGGLWEIAQQWQALSGSSEEFHDLAAWGMFRSITHQVVGYALAGLHCQGDRTGQPDPG